MILDSKLVKSMADLAKLRLAEEDVAEYLDSMTRILALVEEMQSDFGKTK